MASKLTLAVGFAAVYAVRGMVVAGADRQPSAQADAVASRSSTLPAVQQWAGTLSWAASTVADRTRNAWRQAVATVGGLRRRTDRTSTSAPATSGGVIPLSEVPVDQLSEWELDLLTTPDSSK